MNYRVEWTNRALKQLGKLDRSVAEMILRWVRKNLDDCTNPFQHGKPLVANRAGQWRYRVGDYRLICEIVNNALRIVVLEVGHRKKIYESTH